MNEQAHHLLTYLKIGALPHIFGMRSQMNEQAHHLLTYLKISDYLA
jgi:hypothetical protein